MVNRLQEIADISRWILSLEIFLFGLKKNFDAKIQNEKANIYHMDKNLFSNGALEFVLEYL